MNQRTRASTFQYIRKVHIIVNLDKNGIIIAQSLFFYIKVQENLTHFISQITILCLQSDSENCIFDIKEETFDFSLHLELINQSSNITAMSKA